LIPVSSNTHNKVNGAAKNGRFNNPVNPNDLVVSNKTEKQLEGFNIYLNDMETPLDYVEGTVTAYEFTNFETESNVAGVQSVYSTGLSDIVTIDFEVITSVKENIFDNISVYPNPFSNYIDVSGKELISSIRITNLLGQVVLEQDFDSKSSINTSQLPNGIYLVTLFSVNNDNIVYRMFKY